MRPDRAIVQKAIRDAAGNLSRAASILGCSRQSLYTWIYQLGLEKMAGIRLDTRDALDKRVRKDMTDGKSIKTGVYSEPSAARRFSGVASQTVADPSIPATVKLPESLWKRVKIKAIERGCTVAAIVQEALEESMSESAKNGGDR